MPVLFGRETRVVVDTLELAGHRVFFKVEKSLKPEPNQCELSIWNLNEDQRAALEALRPKTPEATRGIPTLIEAGYKDATSQIWLGDLRDVESLPDGPDWVTTLTSGDGEKATQHARIKASYGPKTPVDTVLRAIVRSLGVGEGNLAKVVNQLRISGAGKLLANGAVLSGSAARELTDFCNSADLEWSIQDGAIQFLDRGKALAQQAIELGPETGLVGSPTVDNEGMLKARMLIIPDVRPGALVKMASRRITGNYRIENATWTGDTHAGDWYIDIEAKRY